MADEVPPVKEKQFLAPKPTFAKGITPVQPTEPPKEVLERTFSMDDSLTGSGENSVVKTEDKYGTVVKEQTVKPTILDAQGQVVKEEPKEEPKVEDNILQLEQPKEQKKEDKKEEKKSVLKAPVTDRKDETVKAAVGTKLITPPSKDKIVRNYEGYNADEVAMFKQMSDSAYAYTSNLIKEKKEATKLKDGQYLQHPEAYTLSPEYKETQNNIYYATTEAREWAKALALCKEGKKFRDITGFTKEGKVVFGAEIEPTAETEEAVRTAMNTATQAAQSFTSKLQSHSDNFKQRVQTDLQMIENERKARFAWVADPKMMDYTLSIGDLGDVPIRKLKSDFVSLFPVYMHNTPGVEVASDLFVALQIQEAELREANAGKEIAVTKKDEAIRAEPSSDSRRLPEPEIGGVREFSMAGMPT